jgi:hypothetical protein
VYGLIAGAGAVAEGYLNIDSLLGNRLAYFIAGCLAVVTLFLLARELFVSNRFGYLVAFAFLGCWGFGRHAASGPRPKIPFVLFEVLALWLAARRAWFWAGAAALAFLTWQPRAILVLVIVVVAFLQPGQGQNRWRNVALASAGILTPLLLVVVYFTSQNSLIDFFEMAFLHPLLYVERETVGFVEKLLLPIDQVQQGYHAHGNIALIGVAMVIVLLVWRFQTCGDFRRFVSDDRFATFLLSFPLYIRISTSFRR